MNWKQHLFKPKWQNKSADIRLEAVSKQQHPDLISSLVEIAGTDSDPRVRCAAVKRLHQLGNILKLYTSETDPTVKALQEDRIRQLAASTNDTRPPLQLRMQVIGMTGDRDLIEHLAGHAPEAELRRAALEKVKRQGVLGDCSIHDQDADNRRFAASLITQHTTLKRVIEALRKHDKVLHAELQDRLQKELIEKADPGAIQNEALRICSRLEHLEIESHTRDDAEIAVLHTQWKGISDHVSAAMGERYQRICDRLDTPVTPPKPVATPATYPRPEPELKVSAKPAITEDTKAGAENKLADADKAKKDTEAKAEIAKTEISKQNQETEKALDLAGVLLKKLATELEEGELHKALETRVELHTISQERGKSKAWQSINSRLGGMQSRLRELRDWLHWSNNKIRKRLIAEMEVLPAADLHPDALLDRVKSLQMEWKALEQSEQIPGDKHFASAAWMWRKFSSAGHTAFDIAKPYLDKRSEIQSRHAQSLTTFCAELAQLIKADPPDWTALSKGMNRGRKKLHDLNNIPAKQRQKLARKLKSALDKANALIQEHYQAVEREKMKLIRAASQLIHMPERSDAITQAKSLQSNWKAAGSLWRSKEQELWNQFREHLDPLFAELKEEQAGIRAVNEENLSAQKILCVDMKGILQSKDDLAALHGKVQGLHDAWKNIEHADRKLLRSFQTMLADYHKRVEQAELQLINAERERHWLKSALLHELTVTGRTAKGALSKKTEAKVGKQWPTVSSENAVEKAMNDACGLLLEGQNPAEYAEKIDDLVAGARALAIRLEFIAGLPSPEKDRAQRMQYQVDRLAQTMSGEGTRISVTEEASEAEIAWLGMYALPEPEFKDFGKRIQTALSALTGI